MIIKSSKSFSRMRCAFPWNESKKNWKINTTAAHLLISSLAGVTNQPFLLKKCSKAFNSKILTRSGLKRSLQVYTLSSQLWWINQYSGQESKKKNKKKC